MIEDRIFDMDKNSDTCGGKRELHEFKRFHYLIYVDKCILIRSL